MLWAVYLSCFHILLAGFLLLFLSEPSILNHLEREKYRAMRSLHKLFINTDDAIRQWMLFSFVSVTIFSSLLMWNRAGRHTVSLERTGMMLVNNWVTHFAVLGSSSGWSEIYMENVNRMIERCSCFWCKIVSSYWGSKGSSTIYKTVKISVLFGHAEVEFSTRKTKI